MNEYKYNDFYATDDCSEVLKFYDDNFKLNNDMSFGGESIFSINTILGKVCDLLDKDVFFGEIFNKVLETKMEFKKASKFHINHYDNPIEIPDDIILNNYRKLFNDIAAPRTGRFYTIMSSEQVPDEFKKMLIKYMFTIRKLGNYMPLPKDFDMNGNSPKRGHTINQRKGCKTYLDDPIKFYIALKDYVKGEKTNKKFEEKLYEAYDVKTYEGFLNKNKLDVIYSYFKNVKIEKKLNSDTKIDDFFLSSKKDLQGIYEYMYHACNIINKRHNEFQHSKTMT